MFSKKNNPLLKLHNWLKERPKFIHLCWWFEKHNLPIPPYFIGGAYVMHQTHYGHSDDDNSDPDNNSYTVDSGRLDQPKNTNFILRFQATEQNNGSANNVYAQVWCDTTSGFTASPFQVTTDSSTNPAHIPATGTLSAGNNVSTQLLGSQTQTWFNGWSVINADQSGKFSHAQNNYTEHAFAVQLNNNASDSTTYYFRCYYSATAFGQYNVTAAVTTASATRRIFITHT